MHHEDELVALAQIIATIDGIHSVEDPDDLDHLDRALTDLFTTAHPQHAMDALFRLFERFPTSDGCGIFWTIVHGLEAFPLDQYGPRLVASVRQQPMEFNLMMVNRVLNGGVPTIGAVQLLPLLETIAANPRYSQTARAIAHDFVLYQSNKPREERRSAS